MSKCPHCGGELSATRRLVATSAKDLVESLRHESFIEWINLNIPPHIDSIAELEAFKDRMRTSGYKTNAGPVKDAHAAFRTHLRNAVKFASKSSAPKQPQRTFKTAAKKDE